MRVLAGSVRAVLAALMTTAVVVVPTTPARGDHGVAETPVPCPDGSGAAGTGCWHEEMPDFAVAEKDDHCGLTGTITPGEPYDHDTGATHSPATPLNDDPAHSHFEFIDSLINCPSSDGALAVTADGGNDGHVMDLLCTGDNQITPLPGDPGCGWYVQGDAPVEADQDSDESLQRCSTVYPDLCMPGPGEGYTDSEAQHPYNDHHGVVDESGWSHSSDYSDGPGGGESNACSTAATTANQNKADIVVNGNPGWMKYIRAGSILYAWGCVPGLNPLGHFSAVLSVVPNMLTMGVPGLFPGNLLNPLCPLEFMNHPPYSPPGPGTPASPCGYIVFGQAWRGHDWVATVTDWGPGDT